MADRLSIVVPIMNEIDGLKLFMPQLKALNPYQIIVVDGHSQDGSVEWLKENGYEVVIQSGEGMRNAYLSVWPHVKGDIVVTFSPDGNCIVSEIPQLVRKLQEGYSMVISSRYMPDSKSEDDTVPTRFGNWAFTTMINVLGGGRLRDSLTIYRAYRRELIERLGLPDPRSEWWEKHIGRYTSWEPQLSLRALLNREKITEITSNEPLRIFGETRIRYYRVALSFIVALTQDRMFWKSRSSAPALQKAVNS